MNPIDLVDPEVVAAATAILAEFVGLRATGATEARLASGVASRCAERRLEPAHYLSLLAADGAERQALVELVTVKETSWFREHGHLDALVGSLAGDRHRPIRIWSAGCAGGQEPYSIAIALAEAGHRRFQIVATDLSQTAVDRTERATYRDHELRGLGVERRDRWFERTSEGWVLDPGLRERVTVRQANLLADPPPVGAGSCHAVFCRNVFIYLRRDRMAPCLEAFHRVLAPSGLLVIGASESLYGVAHRFRVEQVGGVFLHLPLPVGSTSTAPQRVTRPRPVRVVPPARRPAPELPRAAAVPSAGELRDEAEAAVRAGRHADAVTAFRKAAYLDPSDPVAHLELGLALEAEGDLEAGRRAYQMARAALARQPSSTVLERLEGWSLDAVVAVLDAKLGVPGCP